MIMNVLVSSSSGSGKERKVFFGISHSAHFAVEHVFSELLQKLLRLAAVEIGGVFVALIIKA